jgi:hydrogenase expression/formation protein HypD
LPRNDFLICNSQEGTNAPHIKTMKYVDEFRSSALVKGWAQALRKITTRPWSIMEVCGGQTHAIVKFGLQALLPEGIELIHGPGCPVCVTPMETIDHALYIADLPETIFCTFGDMLRVPGARGDLLSLKARGADVRIVNTPLQAIEIAKRVPKREVVLFAIGFETTAPATAMTAHVAKRSGLKNFSMLVSHVLVPPALRFLLSAKDHKIDGFLAAGHVCVVTGYSAYHALSNEHRIPIVVTGFEPVDILQGIYLTVMMLEKGTHGVDNQYRRCVAETGNSPAQRLLQDVFCVVDRQWRGIGLIPSSGLGMHDTYAAYDAEKRFPMKQRAKAYENGCISGLILQGKQKPCDCPLFAKVCTPETPYGAPMVSNEGACAAYFHHAMS